MNTQDELGRSDSAASDHMVNAKSTLWSEKSEASIRPTASILSMKCLHCAAGLGMPATPFPTPIGYLFTERREHGWGETMVLDRYGDVEARILCLRPGEQTSVHAHAVRTEFQIPLHGVTATVGAGAEAIELPGGHRAYLIRPGVVHGFRAPYDKPGLVVSLTYGRIENDRL